ncbi:MAG: FAD binding domain-containing protein [Dehalococcoidales bacterium]|jgi:xanthine dehydrogenase YagS FAD-binding subunit|nr:FAD binding domain-containing protein [Dehalococcoidales bacterium]
MKTLTNINAASIGEVESALAEYGAKAKVIAGGTDMVGLLQKWVLPEQPEYLINLKTVTDLDYIREDGGDLKLGAMAKLHDIAFSSVVLGKWSALAAAARAVASWQIRNMGTIGGNICQDTRCWYYRCSWNKFNCLRKGGDMCYALAGNSRFHSIFGAANGCIASHPSDTAPALVALDAKIKTNKRTINAIDFFDGFKGTVLEAGEIVTEIQVPAPPSGSKQGFAKVATRKAIDFAIVNAACLVTPATGNITTARVAVNSAGTKPQRLAGVEEKLVGKTLSASVIAEAAEAAGTGANALPLNKYKIQVTRGVVKKALMA